MTVFARSLGLGYLQNTIQGVVRSVAEGNASFEVDPTRFAPSFCRRFS